MTATTVDVHSLPPLGEQLGRGGQASVFRLPTDPGTEPLLVKKYHESVDPDGERIDDLISWRFDLSEDDRSMLDGHACWPRRRLVDGARTVGVVIPEASNAFRWRAPDNSMTLRELQHLFLVEKARSTGIQVPEPHGRIRIVGQLAVLLEFFARHNLVHGDLSLKNILWRPVTDAGPGIYLLDCDGARFGDGSAPLPIVATQGWADPRLALKQISQPDGNSDLFALAVAFYSCYYGERSAIDHESLMSELSLKPWPPIPDSTLGMMAAGLSTKMSRPRASDWARELADLIRQLDDPSSYLGQRYRNERPEAVTRRRSVPTFGDAPAKAQSVPRPVTTQKAEMSSVQKAVLAIGIGVVTGAALAAAILAVVS